MKKKDTYKLPPCTHRYWIPTKLAPELYEQCCNCGVKRYRDPAKRQPKEGKEQTDEQLKLF